MGFRSLYIKLFSLGLALATSLAIAYVYEAQTLYNKALNQQVILLSDYHEDAQISTAQRLAILQAAKKYDAYLLVEDQAFLYQYLSSQKIIAYQPCLQPLIDDLVNDPVNFDPNRNYEQDFSILDPAAEGDGTPLFLLTHMARHAGIKAFTVECRQAEIVSSSGGPICAADVCRVYDKAAQNIEQYDDGQIYNDYYKKKVAAYRTYQALAQDFFTYLHSYSGTLKQAYANRTFEPEVLTAYARIREDDMLTYYQQQGLSNAQAIEKARSHAMMIADDEDIYEKLISGLYLFLIDAHIIHEIAHNKEHPIIIVYAGGAHIDEVIPVLNSQGYTTVDQCGGTDEAAVDLDYYFMELGKTLIPLSINPVKILTETETNPFQIIPTRPSEHYFLTTCLEPPHCYDWFGPISLSTMLLTT